jgi:hypothetical protein
MTAVFEPIPMIEHHLVSVVARNGPFAGDPGAPILSAAGRMNAMPSVMPRLASV